MNGGRLLCWLEQSSRAANQHCHFLQEWKSNNQVHLQIILRVHSSYKSKIRTSVLQRRKYFGVYLIFIQFPIIIYIIQSLSEKICIKIKGHHSSKPLHNWLRINIVTEIITQTWQLEFNATQPCKASGGVSGLLLKIQEYNQESSI